MAVRTADCVMQATASTGTGPLALGAAAVGYRTLADAVAAGDLVAGDTVPYRVEAVDAEGVPTGDWETGDGTVGVGGTTLTRTSPRAGSAGGAAVSFPAGDKVVFLTELSDRPLDEALVSLVWGVPGAEAGDAIEVSATLRDFAGRTLATDQVDVEVRASDGAADNEPSHTCTLTPAAAPQGTVLAGAGTATLTVRTSPAGGFRVRVTEAAAGFRYLWVRQAGQARRWVKCSTGVLELTFN